MKSAQEQHDPVNHPKHFNSHPSGVECITITEHMNFCLGNAMKYIWRADHKGNDIEDLKKARWYLDREIQRRQKERERERLKIEEVRADMQLQQARQENRFGDISGLYPGGKIS